MVDGVEVSVMECFINSCQCQPIHMSLVLEGQSRVSQPVYSCELDQFVGVGMFFQMWALCEAFRKWNGFGDDVIAEQPSHPCLVVHNTVCHVTPCVLPSSEWRLEQCGLQATPVVFVVSMPFTMSLFACAMIDHCGFTILHSKCTSSIVILLSHLHLRVG